MLTIDDLMDIEEVLNQSTPPKGKDFKQSLLIAEEHLRCLELLRKEIEYRRDFDEHSQ